MEFYGNAFTDYHKVPAHGATVLTVMHTTDPREAAKFIAMFERWLGERDQLPIVGLGLDLQACPRRPPAIVHARSLPNLARILGNKELSSAHTLPQPP
jgi:hypothetical protein